MLQGFGENLAWHPATESSAQPHDQPAPEVQYATYFTHVGFMVLKQYVLHVKLLLHGQNLPTQKDPQTLCSFFRQCIHRGITPRLYFH